jgi:hypothetical protein
VTAVAAEAVPASRTEVLAVADEVVVGPLTLLEDALARLPGRATAL